MAGTIRLSKTNQFLNVVNGNRWVTRAQTYSRIDADAVLDYAELNSGINRGQLAASMHAILQSFENFLCNGHSVTLPEVGTFRFSIRAKAAENEEDAGGDAVTTRKVIYTPSTRMKELLANISLSTDSDDSDDEDED